MEYRLIQIEELVVTMAQILQENLFIKIVLDVSLEHTKLLWMVINFHMIKEL
jgi:hypothetical protein